MVAEAAAVRGGRNGPRWCRQPLPAEGGRPARSLGRAGHRRRTAASARTSAPLPTGSLYWPDAVVPLYSPAQRYATYGQGYGVSPYGTADYGAAYKGHYWAIEPIDGHRHQAGPVLEPLSGGRAGPFAFRAGIMDGDLP